MTEKSSKLVVAVELLYVLVKCSLHFWGWLVTGGFIYGWVSSHKKLVFLCRPSRSLTRKALSTNQKATTYETVRKSAICGRIFVLGDLFIWCVAR